jgi:transcriptional regulator with XRE-family HTH domain
MATTVEIEELGRRIRKLRVERRMTLKQVEEASGLSATHLSEIERGRTSPTIGALVRISRALDRDASYFLEQQELAEVAHVQREHLATHELARGVAAQGLTPGIPGSRLHAYRLELRPGAEFTVPAQEAEGDAIYAVRRGSVEARFGDRAATLGEGDSAHAARSAPHVVRAARGGAELIAVLSGPLEVTS